MKTAETRRNYESQKPHPPESLHDQFVRAANDRVLHFL
jgi:hypothetical protein